LAGDIESIRNYCETDVLNTYLVYLRYQLIRGKLTNDLFIEECQKVRNMLKNERKTHLKEFLEVWKVG
jgi:predicted PolB exonuclease-like 3'-5' exonuclease